MTKGPADNLAGGLRDILLPPPPPWQPDAPGWWAALLLLAIGLLFFMFMRIRRWYSNRYRREALRLLEGLEPSNSARIAWLLPRVMKATALHAYPRADTATLSGHAWLDFLDRTYDGPSFRSDTGRLLLDISYRPMSGVSLSPERTKDLLHMAGLWIRTHEEGAGR